jgi:hypothetical protein
MASFIVERSRSEFLDTAASACALGPASLFEDPLVHRSHLHRQPYATTAAVPYQAENGPTSKVNDPGAETRIDQKAD